MTTSLLNIPVIFGASIEVYFILLIIAIPTFLFWRWIFRKYIKTDKTRKIVTWAVTLITTPFIYIGLILLFVVWMTYTPSKDFDQTKWQTDKEKRFQMANDIIKTNMLIGKDTNQVKQILGVPTRDRSTTGVWTYDIGYGGGGLGFLFHHLHLKLENNKVVSVEHIEIHD